jgi:hypothetical protein
VGVSWFATFSAACCFAYLGAGLPAPTQFVIDMAYEPLSLESLPALVPIAVALGGARLKQRQWTLVGTTLLVLAPQLALLEIIAALIALALPLTSINYRSPLR